MTTTKSASAKKGDTKEGAAIAAESQSGVVIAQLVEAALIGSDRAVPGVKLAEAIASAEMAGVGGVGGVGGEDVTTKGIKEAVAKLNGEYEASGRAFRIEQVAGGYQIMTISACSPVVAALNKAKAATKLGPAAMETLAIIAYKQPVLRADVEAIRGVACGEVIRTLMEKRLVKIAGRAEELGRPILYGTTKIFLEVFGMANLKDLPRIAPPPTASPTASPTPSTLPTSSPAKPKGEVKPASESESSANSDESSVDVAGGEEVVAAVDGETKTGTKTGTETETETKTQTEGSA